MSRHTSISSPSDIVAGLAASENHIAAGLGECFQAFIAAASASPTTPIMIEFGNRTIALGRKRMANMSGRNAFIYLKSKFGLLNATTPLYLQAVFKTDNSSEDRFVEVDMDAWEELVPHIDKLRIMT